MKLMNMNNEKGQIILTLILVMTVALAIGLSVVQKSLVDVSTSTKVEQSSRAFSAAEAGIEKALGGDSSGVNFSDIGSRTTAVSDTGLIPCIPGATDCSPAGSRQDPLEYPPIAKEDVVQVWLADPDSNVRLPDCTPIDPSGHAPVCYNPSPSRTLDVYWGNSATDRAALELTLVYHNVTQYVSRKWYLDHDAEATRRTANSFESVTCAGSTGEMLVTSQYQCKKTIDSLPSGLMLLRARLLYNTTSQPLAVQAVGTCGQDCSIPPQARNITSTGAAGETQRKVNLFQVNKVVPPYFDYAIFSAGEIAK